ncbi:MAG: SGNH/GDSL hydrolase family protein [Lachnospiraceae bacterium]|nr:SGNH/GDSL hydrolase family protein [Lachnospiraceae bacterium]
MRFNKLVRAVIGIALLIVAAVIALPFLIGEDLSLLRAEKIAYIVKLAPNAGEASSEEAAETDPEKTTPFKKRAVITQDYVVIGDSRTKGMNDITGMSANEQLYIIAEVGMGYYWMTGTALPEASGTGRKRYVSLLGVNDLENIDRYLETYRNLIKDGIRLTLVTVGPVEEGRGGYSVTNYEIDKFNERLYEAEGAEVIDLNAYMWKNGFETLDGLHYTNDTYRMIETFLMQELE